MPCAPTEPPWQFLPSASRNSLQSYELSRLAHAANLRKEIGALPDQWMEENACAMLARWLIEQREGPRRVPEPTLGEGLFSSHGHSVPSSMHTGGPSPAPHSVSHNVFGNNIFDSVELGKYLYMLGMKHLEHDPVWYFVDEAGDPTFYGPGKKIIVGQEGCSKTFSVGFLRCKDPQQIRDKLAEVKVACAGSKYLKDIPSLQKSLVGFHAKDDCPEIRFLVYEALQKADFFAQVVVARKREGIFRGGT